MNSKYREAFVWIWLEGKTTPVVAGKLTSEGSDLVFNYGKSYLQRQDKISIYDRELPLQPGSLPLLNGLTMPGCLRDGSPDAWGRRVLIHSKYGVQGKGIDQVQLGRCPIFRWDAVHLIPRCEVGSSGAALSFLLA